MRSTGTRATISDKVAKDGLPEKEQGTGQVAIWGKPIQAEDAKALRSLCLGVVCLLFKK